MKNIFAMPDMTAPLNLWAQMTRIGIESQMIIGMRVAGMMGMMPQAPEESVRMVFEKQHAASESFHAMVNAAGRGARAEEMFSAALHPYGRRTRANARRLTRGARRRA